MLIFKGKVEVFKKAKIFLSDVLKEDVNSLRLNVNDDFVIVVVNTEYEFDKKLREEVY